MRRQDCQFGRTLLNVKRCTCCPPGAMPDPNKAYLKAELENMLAGNEDGLAAEFENLYL